MPLGLGMDWARDAQGLDSVRRCFSRLGWATRVLADALDVVREPFVERALTWNQLLVHW
jgi:hypothetical protein